MTLLALGGLNPAQTTVTTPGSYNVTIAALTTNPQVTFVGPGNYSLTSVAGLLSGYKLIATNGAVLTISGLASVASTANLVVSGPSTIIVGGSVSALSTLNSSFTGTGGTLQFAPGLLSLLNTAPSISGFGASDHLDLGAPIAAGDHLTYAPNGGNTGGTLTVLTSGGTVVGRVTLVGTYTQANFAVGTSPGGDVEVNFACFLRGTRIRTPSGEIAVEDLRPGDEVMTMSGGPVPVHAVRSRSFSDADPDALHEVQPVCFAVGALGDNQPSRPLYVSPDHAMYLDDVLVPSQLLVNGQTIVRTSMLENIEYFHVEISPHDVIFAENAATESYLDIGNAAYFAYPNVVTLFPTDEPKTWEDACAPLILTGPALQAIRKKLAIRAAGGGDDAQTALGKIA